MSTPVSGPVFTVLLTRWPPRTGNDATSGKSSYKRGHPDADPGHCEALSQAVYTICGVLVQRSPPNAVQPYSCHKGMYVLYGFTGIVVPLLVATLYTEATLSNVAEILLLHVLLLM